VGDDDDNDDMKQWWFYRWRGVVRGERESRGRGNSRMSSSSRTSPIQQQVKRDERGDTEREKEKSGKRWQ
jgi:hypothetical protein